MGGHDLRGARRNTQREQWHWMWFRSVGSDSGGSETRLDIGNICTDEKNFVWPMVDELAPMRSGAHRNGSRRMFSINAQCQASFSQALSLPCNTLLFFLVSFRSVDINSNFDFFFAARIIRLSHEVTVKIYKFSLAHFCVSRSATAVSRHRESMAGSSVRPTINCCSAVAHCTHLINSYSWSDYFNRMLNVHWRVWNTEYANFIIIFFGDGSCDAKAFSVISLQNRKRSAHSTTASLKCRWKIPDRKSCESPSHYSRLQLKAMFFCSTFHPSIAVNALCEKFKTIHIIIYFCADRLSNGCGCGSAIWIQIYSMATMTVGVAV